jgi:hypothetical protein
MLRPFAFTGSYTAVWIIKKESLKIHDIDLSKGTMWTINDVRRSLSLRQY